MADRAILRAASPFAGLLSAHAVAGRAGVIATERVGLGMATVLARNGQSEALASVVRDAFGIDLADGPRVSTRGDVAFVGVGPGTWLAVRENGGWRFAGELTERLGQAAAVSDQSSGYGVLRLSGPDVRRALAKGVPVDLHPSAFGPGSAAVTLASHVGIVLWRADEAPSFDVAVFRSMAGSFAHWLEASAAEFGLGLA